MAARICVAGATGVLGRALLPRLVADGHDVRAIRADVLSEHDLLHAVAGCDSLIQIATAAPDRAAVTRRLLDAALSCGVERFLHQSVVTAYRDGGDAWLDEQAPLDDSPRRAAVCRPVIQMEAMIRAVDPRRLAWTVLRAGMPVGPGTTETALIGCLRSGTATVACDGRNYVSPVSVADLAAAIAAAVQLAPPGTTFNVVDEPLRYGDYVDALADLIGAARPRRIDVVPSPPSWRCTNGAAKTALSWWPRERIWPCVDREPSASGGRRP